MIALNFLTLVDVLQYHVTHQPGKTVYTFLQDGEVESGKLTYRELDQQAQNIAAYLGQRVNVGDRALLLYPSGLEFIAAFMGCLYAGVVAVPAYPPRRNQKLSRLEAIVGDAQPSIVLTTSSIFTNLQQQWGDHPQLSPLACVDTKPIAQTDVKNWHGPEITAHTLAFLQYTSGSTGNPKGVMVSQENLMHNCEIIRQSFQLTAESVSITWLPNFHDMGLIDGVLQPLYVGFPGYIMPPTAFLQRPQRWLQAISKYGGIYGAVHSGGPNFAYDLCCQRITAEQRESLDLRNWQSAYNGAEPVHGSTLEQFTTTFSSVGFNADAFYPCYGMAETTLMVTGVEVQANPNYCTVDAVALGHQRVLPIDPSHQNAKQLVGCGKPWLDTTIVVVDPETRVQCPENQVGEIWVAGKSVTQGYWNQPQITEATFNAYLANSQQGPFLRTGDLGFVLEDELYVTGRLKDILIVRGQNHYPQDIEQTVQKNHPSLRSGRGAAFLVNIADQERLVIVQEVERTYLRRLDVNHVVRQLRKAVSAHHGLQLYAAVLVKPGSIPLTSSGKIQRHACRNGYLNSTLRTIHEVIPVSVSNRQRDETSDRVTAALNLNVS